MTTDRRLALTLSGGGFRATLFHLGVIRYLYESRLLSRILRVGAVSGGSVLAAHVVLKWDRYTGDEVNFARAASEVLAFTRADIRGRVVRRWLLAWLTLFPRILMRNRWTFTNLLQRYYDRLYDKATLDDLRPTEEVARPQVFFYATSLSTGAVCSFGRSGFMWDEHGEEKSVIAPLTPLSLAVAASSAFPPLFPPIAISHKMLACDRAEFPHTNYLTDGGVYDNLGIDRLLWFHETTPDIDKFIVSDAGGNVDWKLENSFTSIIARNVRASDLLMKRVGDLERMVYKDHIRVIDIKSVVNRPGDDSALTPQAQRLLRNVRTDLDAFSPLIAGALIRHGYALAQDSLIREGLIDGPAREFTWKIPDDETTAADLINLTKLRRSQERRLRAWSFRDWASWSSLLVVLCAVGLALTPLYRREAQLAEQVAEQAAVATSLSEVNQRLSRVAVQYFRQRHRPVEPGMSAGHYETTTGTICCVVRERGTGRRFLLGSDLVFAPQGFQIGDPILQPGPIDGGEAEDAVARLAKVLRPTGGYPPIAALAELLPNIDADQIIAGLGPITGIERHLQVGQEVFVAGRTSGVLRAVVDSIDYSLSIPYPGFEQPLNLRGLVSFREPPGQTWRSAGGGDAGAPVVTSDGRLAAMSFAGTPNLKVAVPIHIILDGLDVELEGIELSR